MNKKLKVLVVDDDRRMVKTICDILRVKGYDTIKAYSGEEAVERVTKEAVDCVLMDIKMPGIDGVEALTIIRGTSPELPVVLMSAHASEAKTEEVKRQGGYAVLDKPLNIQQILSFLSLLRKEESILIVDNDPGFCQTLKDIIQARGYQVKTETEAQKVLEQMEQNYKLLVVLNVELCTAEREDILVKIREHYPTKPVVLVAEYKEGVAASIERGLQIGAHICLYKPFEIEELIRVIKDVSKMKLKNFLDESF